MSSLAQQVKVALDEDHILILGVQVLVAIEFRTIFERRFAELSATDQAAALTGLGLLLVTLGVLMMPVARHRLVEGGQPTSDVQRFVTRVVGWALLPFAVATGLNLYVTCRAVLPARVAAAIGAVTAVVGWFLWHTLGVLRRWRRRRRGRRRRQRERERADPPAERTEMERDDRQRQPDRDPAKDLEQQVNFALTELRVVLPGAQALLGFQAAIMFTDAFARLPERLKYAHLASLLLIIFTVILLMTPAAYHRIADAGEYSRHLLRFASRILVAALMALGLGMSLELYVVVEKVADRPVVAVGTAAGMLLAFYGMWFGYAFWARQRRRRRRAGRAVTSPRF